MKTNTKPYDIIGDIHGHADTLRALITKLGYVERDGAYCHPGRTAIFVGDFIDKGPEIRETLQIVKAMVDGGAAFAIMGNHEINAIGYHTPNGNGGHVREHTARSSGQHAATLEAFVGYEGEWRDYLQWFEALPLFLDLDGLRIIHACWDERAIAALEGDSRFYPSLLTAKDAKRDAMHTLLKGPEVDMPDGFENHGSKEMRVKWWLSDEPVTYRNAALQVPFELPDEPLTGDDREKVCGYASDAPPVFFGHYGFLKPAEPLAPNVACIDLGVTRGGPLCAYRWDGERILDPTKFVCAAAKAETMPPQQ